MSCDKCSDKALKKRKKKRSRTLLLLANLRFLFSLWAGLGWDVSLFTRHHVLACNCFLGACVILTGFPWSDVTHRCFLGAEVVGGWLTCCLSLGVVFLWDYCELRRPWEKGAIDSESQGDTLRRHRAARNHLNSCTAAVRAGTIRMQLLWHSETALPKRRKFDHLAALLTVVRQVPSVHEQLVPFAPVGDREARVPSAPEPLPAQRNECVWNLPEHTPLRCQLARPRLVCASRQRRATVLSLSPCGGRAKDTRRLAVNCGVGDIK